MFICGSGSFGHQEEDDDHYNSSSSSPCRTPKRSRRSASFRKIIGRSDDKNPYAKRGLDKFYALLAEHDDKKQKIYREMGSEEISIVRFEYPHDSDRVKPIIVKVKADKKPQADERNNDNSGHEVMKAEAEGSKNTSKDSSEKGTNDKNYKLTKKKKSLSYVVESLKKPYFYLPFLVVLILMLLAIYGRSFAILCTSIGWYMIPTASSPSETSLVAERKLKRKKEHARKQKTAAAAAAAKVVVRSPGPSSPKSVINGLSELRR